MQPRIGRLSSGASLPPAKHYQNISELFLFKSFALCATIIICLTTIVCTNICTSYQVCNYVYTPP